MTFTLVFTIS